ncbi:hypothetical protein PROFUN_00885 [Planoprotostelium fungivorum]|uniref:Uncharacterized protein n=1 Tax=Planoprotostelium fungivorum TaxID=1890364 RepID=A0A2P6P079_9EUKA|nr:hypothetical protein PROFUN_00885 [Planoprotostelium fungivorum]
MPEGVRESGRLSRKGFAVLLTLMENILLTLQNSYLVSLMPTALLRAAGKWMTCPPLGQGDLHPPEHMSAEEAKADQSNQDSESTRFWPLLAP